MSRSSPFAQRRCACLTRFETFFLNAFNRENLVLEVNACARLTRERCERFFEDHTNIGS